MARQAGNCVAGAASAVTMGEPGGDLGTEIAFKAWMGRHRKSPVPPFSF